MGMMTMEDKMELVLCLAEEGMNQGELPIAAIIFLGDKIVSKSFTTEKVEGRYLVHAELNAILEMDKQKYSITERHKMQLFTNLEPCMMCFGSVIHSFIGEVYYSIDSPTDGGAVWSKKTWNNYHQTSLFNLPKIYSGILAEKSKSLFKRYLELSPKEGMADWVKTLL